MKMPIRGANGFVVCWKFEYENMRCTFLVITIKQHELKKCQLTMKLAQAVEGRREKLDMGEGASV